MEIIENHFIEKAIPSPIPTIPQAQPGKEQSIIYFLPNLKKDNLK